MAGGALPDEATQLTLAEFRDGNLLARHIAPLRLARVLWRTTGFTSKNDWLLPKQLSISELVDSFRKNQPDNVIHGVGEVRVP
jgi:hypothetical protein